MATALATVVSPDDVGQLAEQLYDIAVNWELFLGLLKVSRAKSDQIKRERAHSPNSAPHCLLDGLEHWVTTDDSPSYEKIINALNSKMINNKPLALKIKQIQQQTQQKTQTNKLKPNKPKVQTSKVKQSKAKQSKAKQTVAMKSKSVPQPANRSTSDSTSSDPDASETFPHLKTDLNEAQRRSLKGRLMYEKGEIQSLFAKLVFGIYNSLKKEKVELCDLVFFMQQCPLVQQCKLTDGSSKPYENEYEIALHNVVSLVDLFDVIGHFYSFFNYGLIEDLIDTFGSSDDKQRLTEYKKEFNDFCKRRVYECPDGSFGEKGENEMEVLVKLRDELDGYTFEAVNLFRHKLCVILELEGRALRFIGVADGCIEISFVMFSSLEDMVFPLSDEQMESLRSEGVIQLTTEKYYYNQEKLDTTVIQSPTSTVSGSDDFNDEPDRLYCHTRRPSQQQQQESIASSIEPQPPLYIGRADLNELLRVFEQGVPYAIHKRLALADTSVKTITDSDGKSLLHLACRHSYIQMLEIAKTLVEAYSCDPSAIDSDGNTPLHDACSYNNEELAKYLLTLQSCHPVIKNSKGETALHISIAKGSLDIVRTLLASGRVNPTLYDPLQPVTVYGDPVQPITVDGFPLEIRKEIKTMLDHFSRTVEKYNSPRPFPLLTCCVLIALLEDILLHSNITCTLQDVITVARREGTPLPYDDVQEMCSILSHIRHLYNITEHDPPTETVVEKYLPGYPAYDETATNENVPDSLLAGIVTNDATSDHSHTPDDDLSSDDSDDSGDSDVVWDEVETELITNDETSQNLDISFLRSDFEVTEPDERIEIEILQSLHLRDEDGQVKDQNTTHFSEPSLCTSDHQPLLDSDEHKVPLEPDIVITNDATSDRSHTPDDDLSEHDSADSADSSTVHSLLIGTGNKKKRTINCVRCWGKCCQCLRSPECREKCCQCLRSPECREKCCQCLRSPECREKCCQCYCSPKCREKFYKCYRSPEFRCVIIALSAILSAIFSIIFISISEYAQPPTGSVFLSPNDVVLVRSEGFDFYYFGTVMLHKNNESDLHNIIFYTIECSSLVTNRLAVNKHNEVEINSAEHTTVDSNYLLAGSELTYELALDVNTTENCNAMVYIFDDVTAHMEFIYMNGVLGAIDTICLSNDSTNFTITASKASYYFVDIGFTDPRPTTVSYSVSGEIFYYDTSSYSTACEIVSGNSTSCTVDEGNNFCLLAQVDPLPDDKPTTVTFVQIYYFTTGFSLRYAVFLSLGILFALMTVVFLCGGVLILLCKIRNRPIHSLL